MSPGCSPTGRVGRRAEFALRRGVARVVRERHRCALPLPVRHHRAVLRARRCEGPRCLAASESRLRGLRRPRGRVGACFPDDDVDGLKFAGVGLLGGAAQYFIICALQRAPASVVSPIGYAELITAAAFGYALFGDIPDRYTRLGAALVVHADVGAATVPLCPAPDCYTKARRCWQSAWTPHSSLSKAWTTRASRSPARSLRRLGTAGQWIRTTSWSTCGGRRRTLQRRWRGSGRRGERPAKRALSRLLDRPGESSHAGTLQDHS